MLQDQKISKVAEAARDRFIRNASLAEAVTDPSPIPVLKLRRKLTTAVFSFPDGANLDRELRQVLVAPWFDFRRFDIGDGVTDEVAKFGEELIREGLLRLPLNPCVFVFPSRSDENGMFATIMRLIQAPGHIEFTHVAEVYRQGPAFIAATESPWPALAIASFYLTAMSSRQARVNPHSIATGERRQPRSAADTDVYRVVTIEHRDGVSRGDGSGSHASPRLHWRRGHIRALDGARRVWVRPALVGDGEHGTVVHDYQGARA